MPAVSAINLFSLKDVTAEFEVIGIDEGQFFPDVVEFSQMMADGGKTVIVAALDGTFQRQGFGNILNLVPLAESVNKLTAVCMKCYGDASYTKRKGHETALEVIGGADKYMAVCRSCFESPQKQTSNITPTTFPVTSQKLAPTRQLFKSPVKVGSPQKIEMR
ncbi:PREDICTED: thymidine kinase, cytosolic-like [Priapulus caudatus]|uniref:Thymidine kinase n=1 Tax=Priapulus caudatus TaxID=37621 RepID=A0ABM1E2S0_PRICU|nr:PREDICTED: thymidine kinase, cytosolic-like [Priapulus caudatus]